MTNPNISKGFHTIGFDEVLLSQKVVRQVYDLIQSNILRPGDRLPSEHELSERLGVSRTVVREAINLLKAGGVVTVKLGVGSYVTEPSLNILDMPLQILSIDSNRTLRDLQQVRQDIEPPIAALAAQHATLEQIQAMETAVQRMLESLDDLNQYIAADDSFHYSLAEASENSVFLLFVHSIVNLLQKSRGLAAQSPGATQRANTFHMEILEAVRARDSERAYRSMFEHISQINDDIGKVTGN